MYCFNIVGLILSYLKDQVIMLCSTLGIRVSKSLIYQKKEVHNFKDLIFSTFNVYYFKAIFYFCLLQEIKFDNTLVLDFSNVRYQYAREIQDNLICELIKF